MLIKGPVVMKGYRNLPDKTAETFTDDGYLLTGDIGEFDEDGYLKIVDRKKELIITAAGKNLSPANIEARLKQIPLVSQAIAIGDKRKYVSALLTLDPEAAKSWASEHGVDGDLASLAENEELIAEVEKGLDVANEELARVEQVKRFKVLPPDWEPGGDELTPTMKLKRKPIAEKYAAEIDSLYDALSACTERPVSCPPISERHQPVAEANSLLGTLRPDGFQAADMGEGRADRRRRARRRADDDQDRDRESRRDHGADPQGRRRGLGPGARRRSS